MLEFILQPQVISLIVLVLVALIGWRGRKWLNHFRLVFQIWHWVEKMSIVNDWHGYDKLALAMGEFELRFYDEFGREPDPSDEGWAVKMLTWLCKIEDKEPVGDFSDPSTSDSDSENLNEGA